MANIDNPLDDWVRPHMRQSLIEAHDSDGAQSLPVSQARDRIRIDIVQDLAAIEPDWRQFENRAAMTVFQTYDWLAAWQRAYQRKQRAEAAEARRQSAGAQARAKP